MVIWWARSDSNREPTRKRSGLLLTVGLRSLLFQQKKRESRILLPLHAAFKVSRCARRVQLQRGHLTPTFHPTDELNSKGHCGAAPIVVLNRSSSRYSGPDDPRK